MRGPGLAASDCSDLSSANIATACPGNELGQAPSAYFVNSAMFEG